LAITSGTLVGQVVVAAATPFLSRMYPPEAFGAFSAILAIASAIGPAAAFKFDSALLLPKTDADAKNLLGLALAATAVTSTITGAVLAVLGPLLFQEIWEALPFAPLWIAALVLATGMFTSLVQATLRSKSYGLLGWRSAIQSIGTTIAQLGVGMFYATAGGLLGGALFGRLLGFGALTRSLRPILKARGGSKPTSLIREYWRSPVILAPSSLLNALGSQLPLVLVAAWFGADMAGQLGMAQRLVFLPAALIGAALAQVFGAEIAQRLREQAGSSRGLYLKATWQIGLVAVPMCAAILLASPFVLPWILGPEWEQSGYLAQAMALSASVGLIVSPLSQVYLVHQSPASLVMDSSRVALIFGAGSIALSLQLPAVATVWVLYAAQVVNYIATWIYGLRIVSRPTDSPLDTASRS
jgi:O-antigen/teichoic acid export membrane protein